MIQKSEIKVWLHVESMSLVLSYHVFARVDLSIVDMPLNAEITSYQYIAEAVENPNCMVCLFQQSDLLSNFEFIGML